MNKKIVAVVLVVGGVMLGINRYNDYKVFKGVKNLSLFYAMENSVALEIEFTDTKLKLYELIRTDNYSSAEYDELKRKFDLINIKRREASEREEMIKNEKWKWWSFK